MDLDSKFKFLLDNERITKISNKQFLIKGKIRRYNPDNPTKIIKTIIPKLYQEYSTPKSVDKELPANASTCRKEIKEQLQTIKRRNTKCKCRFG